MARVRVVKDDNRSALWWWLLALVLVAAAIAQAYYLGSIRGALRVGENLDDRAALLAVQDRSFVILDQQQTRIRELAAQLNTQRKLTELEVQAGAEMQKELQAVLYEQRHLMEQLNFYQNIVGTEATKAGVSISDIRLRPGETPQHFTLVITMAQVKKHDVRVTGRISLSVYGDNGGVQQELSLAQLHPEQLASQKIGYRFFQTVSIPLVLPRGFEPKEVAIEFDIKRPRASQILEERDWFSLLR